MPFYRSCKTPQALLAVVLTALSLFAAAPVSAQPTGRNVIFIAIDDLRNWVNYAGDYAGTVHTPNIDALAANSTRYLNAYTTMVTCAGSRASVMMGQSPATHGLDFASWGLDQVYKDIYENPAIASLPQVMKAGGYYTAGTGKVFHKPYPAQWDEHGPEPQLSSLISPFDPGPHNTFLYADVTPESEEHPDQTVANWASDFISNYDSTQPFFLATGFLLPHIPWNVPQWAYDLYPLENVIASIPIPNDLDDEPAAAQNLAQLPLIYGVLPQYDAVTLAGQATNYTQAYLAAISHTDRMVGQLLTALANSPHANNTDIILWSDHGYHLGEKFHWRKGTFWEQSAKVPLLVSSPGNPDYPVGDVTEEVSLLDLAPTVLDLAGLPAFGQFEGAPLHDANNRSLARVYFYGGRATIRNGIKIIDYDLDQIQGLDDLAAYNLSTDPGEEHNVILPLLLAILQAL